MIFVQVGPGRWVNIDLAEEIKAPEPAAPGAAELEIVFASGRSRNLSGDEAASLRRFLAEYGRRIDERPPPGGEGGIAGSVLVEDSESGPVILPPPADRRESTS